MIPAVFPQANAHFGPPAGIAESQVAKIVAYVGFAGGGSMDGSPIVVVAWTPTLADLQTLSGGGHIFLTFVGGLAPHMVTTDFATAIHPA